MYCLYSRVTEEEVEYPPCVTKIPFVEFHLYLLIPSVSWTKFVQSYTIYSRSTITFIQSSYEILSIRFI